MESILNDLRLEYKEKFTALLKVAEIFEKTDNDVYMKCLKKAAGCKLMIEEYDLQLSILKKRNNP